MYPCLASGDEVLIDPRRRPQPGDVVVAYHPLHSTLAVVKRVERVEPDGRLFLESDNRDSIEPTSDSRSYGAVDPQRVLGVVVYRLPL
jgi:phage repressor protein C with HTH and peptisase S24 domain